MSEKRDAILPVRQEENSISSVSIRPNYFREAFMNRLNLTALAAAAGLSAVIVNPLPLVFAAGAELVYLGTIPGMKRFRRLVDARHFQKWKMQEYSMDADIYRNLSPQQQGTVNSLKELRDNIHSNYSRLTGGAQIFSSPSLVKVDNLISSFLRLIEQLNAYRRYLGATDRDRIANELNQLSGEIREEENERLRGIKSRRLKILEQRHSRFLRAEENREVISHQLAAIEDILRLIHEQSLTARDPGDISRMLDTLAVEVEETEDTIREMESFLRLQAEMDEMIRPEEEN